MPFDVRKSSAFPTVIQRFCGCAAAPGPIIAGRYGYRSEDGGIAACKSCNPTGALLRGANGERRAVKTDRFGVYRFSNVARNRIYQLSVTHRQFEFTPRLIMVREENINNFNFTALQ